MIPDDFFTIQTDSIFGPSSKPTFDRRLVTSLRDAPLDKFPDVEAAIALSHLVHDELMAFGTGGGQTLNDSQISDCLRSLRAVLLRLDIKFEIDFRNFATFKTWWMREGADGNYQARRELLADIFNPIDAHLLRLEEDGLDALAYPITPHTATGWPAVDEEIRQLRKSFKVARSPLEYRAIGTNCVGILEALGSTVYEPAIHLRDGEAPPPVDKTKMRIGRFVEVATAGPENADLRGLVNKAVELAHHVKHDTTTRRDAGICADAIIMLANILRRLDQDL